MSNFLQHNIRISPLSPVASEDLESHLKTKVYQKGDVFNKEEVVCRDFFFIDYGLVKHSY